MAKEYVYLVKRKSDGKKFVTFGNFKVPGLRPSCLFQFAPETYQYKKPTPYGMIYNISCDLRYDSKHYSIIHQAEKTKIA